MKKYCSFILIFLIVMKADAQTELIVNGDYTALGNNWSISGPYWFISSSFSCYSSATAYAYVGTSSGGGANLTYGSISQNITIPANATNATLKFKLSINTDEITTSLTNDILEVQLREVNLNLLHTFAQYSNLNGATPSSSCQSYQTFTFTIPSNYFGQSLLLNFQTASNASLFTKFRLDDVSIIYQEAASCVIPSTAPNPSKNSPPCGSVTLTRQGSVPSNEIWYWQGKSSCSTRTDLGSGSTYTANSSGTYYIRAFNTNGGGCWSNSCGSVDVTVISGPTVTADASTPVTAPDPINLFATTISGATYSWTGPNGFTSIAQNPIRNISDPSMSGDYCVTASVSGCSSIPSCKTVIVNSSPPPNVNSITFTNKIENHNGITPLYTLYTGPANILNAPIKICADGSTATFIKVNVSNTTAISFRILDENNNPISDVNKYGVLGTLNIFGNNIEVPYTHPQYIELGLFRNLTLQVLHNGLPISGINFPLNIYRAPIVFVHGFYGNRGTFKECAEYLVVNNIYPPFQQDYNSLIQFVDYEATNGYSLKSNRKVIKSNIDIALIKAREENFSCSRVILIAHSMGGLLSRLYLQSTWSGVPYRFDIQKFVTLNTPHFGTQFANLMNHLNKGLNSTLLTYVIKQVLLGLSSEFNGTGAVEDMMVDSREVTQYLNVPLANQNIVPTHTISTVKLAGNVTSDAESLEKKAAKILSHLPNLFNGELNDLIVPLSSQKANFSWAISSDDQFHIGSSREDVVKSEIMNLVNSDPFDISNFSLNGFSPGQLTSIYRNSNLSRLTSGDSIYFILPLRNQIFNYGDSIPIGIQSTGNIDGLFYIENIYDSASFAFDTSLSSINTKIKPKSSQMGKITMAILGRNGNGIVTADTSSIYINPPSGIINLEVKPEVLEIGLGQNARVNINAIYSNNSILNLNNVSNLLVTTDPNKVTYLGNGIFYAKEDFDSTIIFSYEGKSDTIRIKIMNSSTSNVTSFSYNKYKTCSENAIFFYDQSRGPVISRSWIFQGGVPSASSAMNPVVAYNLPGKFNVTLITTFVNGLDTLTIDSLIEVSIPNKTIISGNWKNPLIWSCGQIPSIEDSVIISSGNIVNIDSTAQVRKLTIENNGSIIIDNPAVVFTVGAESDKANPVLCNGSLDIVNGSLKINGRLVMTNSGRFNMRGGELIIDGNTGDSITSVPDGQHLFNISTSCSNFNFTGGILRFINPPLGANSQAINCSYNFGILSTTYFGDGISTIPSYNVYGFGGNLLPSKIGKLIFDPATTWNNRTFTNLNPLIVFKEFKILSGNVVQGALLQVIDSTGTNFVTDIDGNIYTTITIGTQVWMVENLKTSRYKNGDPITTGLNDAQWHTATTGAYSIYNDNCDNNDKYGKLYNWYAVTDPRGIAPVGWHVPSDAEWNVLINYLGGASTAGGAMKAVSPLWNNPNNGATNSSGFTGLPGGHRNDGNWPGYNVHYGGLGFVGYWWTRSQNNNPVGSAWDYSLLSNYVFCYPAYDYKGCGFSVRLIKN